MEDKKPKKPFRDTKLGQFLSEKLPQGLEIVGNVLPDSGALAIVKNIISKSGIPAEDLREGYQLVSEMEVELEKIAAQDRDSARRRETEYVKATGHADYMMIFVGLFMLVVYAFAIHVVVNVEIPMPNRDLFIHTMGLVEGTVMCICSYYFGSSKGSTEKNRILKG